MKTKEAILKELGKENWHAITGDNGMCACGDKLGICNQRLETFLSSALDRMADEARHEALEEVKERVQRVFKNNARLRMITEEYEVMGALNLPESGGKK